MQPVKIDEFSINDCNYQLGDYKYKVTDLIEVSKNIKSFDLPLQGIDLSVRPWGENMTIDSYIYHANRMSKADLKYPIILDNRGYICDGWHRVTKAIIEGRTTIKAVRLTIMPDVTE